MKKILTIMVLYLQIGQAQCYEEKYRYNYYDYLEVLNLYTGEYEKFKNQKDTYTIIEIRDNKNIDVLFTTNNSRNKNKVLEIVNCQYTDSTIIYNCYDYMQNRVCRLIFGESTVFYELTIRYMEPVVIFKVRRNK